MRSDGMTQLRQALQSFCPTGADTEAVGVPQLAEVLGLETESQKQVLRRRLSEMRHRNEVRKTGRGLFVYVPGKEPSRTGEGYPRMWRAVRVQNTPFRIREIAQITRLDGSTVSKYFKYLENERLIAHAGQDGNTRLYRVTTEGLRMRHTPYPPVEAPDPFRPERAACAALCRLLMLENLYTDRVRRQIRENLKVLTARFTQSENNPNESLTESTPVTY